MSHCLGSSVTGRLVGPARRRVRERMARSIEHLPTALEPVLRLQNVGPEEFVQRWLGVNQPVVLEGAAKDWPAVQRWNPAFFGERYGTETIRLLSMGPGDVDNANYTARETSLADAIDVLETSGNKAYCRFLPTLMEHPELRRDLDMAWFLDRRGPMSTAGNFHLFIGGAGTETGLHSAVSANLFLQVHGTKRWTLYSPQWTPVFEPPMDRAMYFVSAFDPERPDYERFPDARHLQGYEVVLEPGDILWNPPFWWHKVSNPTTSIGLGYRWFPPQLCFEASPIQWLLTYLSVNPPLWAGIGHKLDFTRIFADRRF